MIFDSVNECGQLYYFFLELLSPYCAADVFVGQFTHRRWKHRLIGLLFFTQMVKLWDYFLHKIL